MTMSSARRGSSSTSRKSSKTLPTAISAKKPGGKEREEDADQEKTEGNETEGDEKNNQHYFHARETRACAA